MWTYDIVRDSFRRLIMRLWTLWVRWVYGASFERKTEQYLPETGLELLEKRILYQDTIKLIAARPASAG